MSQARRRIPSYRLHKSDGRAVVTLNGRDVFLGKHGTEESRQRYDRLIAEWLANDRRLSTEEKPVDLTIVELVARFWEHAQVFYRKPDGSPSGELENYRQALRPLKALYGLSQSRDFGPRCLKAVRQKMVELGWCRGYINKQASRIRSMFKWAVSEQLLPVAVHQALLTVGGLRKGKTEAREARPVKPVPEAHLEATKPFLSPVVQAMVDVQLLTGMRPTETCIMRGVDLDMSGEVWIYRPQFHKTEHHGHTRDVWVGPKAQELLKPFLKADLTGYLFSPKDAEARRYAQAKKHRRPNQKPNTRQTDRTLRDRYDVHSYRRAIARACEKAFPLPEDLACRRVPTGQGEGDERLETYAEWKARLGAEKWAKVRRWRQEHSWHPHQLRHNAATRLRREFGIEVARVILGHKSAIVTEVYAEQDREKAKTVMGKVG